ncbi:nitroreductase family protein [Fidelibacter multiformis]|uniref:nitroreductase family protein n=1 Tax=Fidelibacter multiformis TaxID=3377529 RepID=UPI0037DC15C0
MKCGVVSLIMLMLSTGLFAGEENIIPLPQPEKTGGMPLMEALNQRHSGRSFQDKALTDQILSNLLWAAFGVNRENGKRTAPSSQGKTEMEIYVAKSDGLFLYLPEKNALKKILDEDIRAKTGKQNFVADAPVNLIFVANYKKAGNVDPEKYRYTSGMNTGFISQNVYLYCASAELATVVRGWFDENELRKAMKLKDHKGIILTQTVGYPK